MSHHEKNIQEQLYASYVNPKLKVVGYASALVLLAGCGPSESPPPKDKNTIVEFRGSEADMNAKGLHIVESQAMVINPETSCTATRIGSGWLTLARHCIEGVPGLDGPGQNMTDSKPNVLRGSNNHWFSLWQGDSPQTAKRLGDINMIVRGDPAGPDFALVHQEDADDLPGLPIANDKPQTGQTFTITGYPRYANGQRTTDRVEYLDTIPGTALEGLGVSADQQFDVYGVPNTLGPKPKTMNGYSGATVMRGNKGYSIVNNCVPDDMRFGDSYTTTLDSLLKVDKKDADRFDQYILAMPLSEELAQDWIQ